MAQTDTAIKTPKFQTKIHLPEIPGSFTFKKSGKLRLDQQVKKFCLLNKSRGCFEVKVHFGIHINPNKIKYDANQNGITIDTLNDQQKYKLFVPYPKGLELLIPDNPEAQFFCGVLSAKLAIIKYNKSQLNTKAKNRKTDAKVEASEATDDNDAQQSKQKHQKMGNATRKNKNNKKKKRNQKRNRLSLDDLNKRIARNTNDEPTNPPKKKRKLNKKEKTKKKPKIKETTSNEMDINEAHELIDGVVDKIENDIKQKRQTAVRKDDDIKEYLAKRAEKKRNKQQRKMELREKFLQRRNAKKNIKTHHKSFKKTTAKKVRFNV